MFNVEDSTNDVVGAILKDRPLEEQVKILRELYVNVLDHEWVDEGLRDNILSKTCKEYDVTYRSIDECDCPNCDGTGFIVDDNGDGTVHKSNCEEC